MLSVVAPALLIRWQIISISFHFEETFFFITLTGKNENESKKKNLKFCHNNTFPAQNFDQGASWTRGKGAWGPGVQPGVQGSRGPGGQGAMGPGGHGARGPWGQEA